MDGIGSCAPVLALVDDRRAGICPEPVTAADVGRHGIVRAPCGRQDTNTFARGVVDLP
jgi:hypothetical protein